LKVSIEIFEKEMHIQYIVCIYWMKEEPREVEPPGVQASQGSLGVSVGPPQVPGAKASRQVAWKGDNWSPGGVPAFVAEI